MMRLALLLLAAAPLAAQTWTYPLNPRSTFLRTNNDSPQPPLVVDLGALGVAPGTWLRVGTTGGFSYISGGADGFHSLIGVFSSSSTLLATSVQNRVPGAIGAGPSFPSGSTYYGALPMDIPEDFFASRNLWDDAITVRVPAGAAFLFLGVHDSLYNDNNDPNGDYTAVVSVAPTPTLPGSGEHLELRCDVGAPPVSFPDVHPTTPGAPMQAWLYHPVGFADGGVYVFVGEAIPTSSAPVMALPDLWVSNLIVLQFGVVPNTPGWTDLWSMSTPGGYSGTTLVIQAGALFAGARNGIYETTNAHRFVL